MKEKKKVFDTNNNTFYKLLKFLSETITNGYEIFNFVSDNGDSIYSLPLEELISSSTSCGGQVFVSENAIEEIVNRIIDQRFGPSLNNHEND